MKKYILIISVFCLLGFAFFLFASSKESSLPSNVAATIPASANKEKGVKIATWLAEKFSWAPPMPSSGNAQGAMNPPPVGWVASSDSDFFSVDRTLPKEKEAKRLLELYKSSYLGTGIKGRIILEAIDSLGLEKNAGNLRAIQALLKSKTSDDERIILVRILPHFYSRDDVTGLNNEILADLKDLVHTDRRNGGAAASFYCNLGYFPDSESILDYAKNAGFFDSKNYYAELARLFDTAPQDAKKRIIDAIKLGDDTNDAINILISAAHSQEEINALSPDGLISFKEFLGAREPKFSESGFGGSLSYTEWLWAMAMLNGVRDGAGWYQYVNKELNNDTSDPRKIIDVLAVTDEEQSIQLIRDFDRAGALEKIQQRIAAYTAKNREDPNLQYYLSQIERKIKEARAKK